MLSPSVLAATTAQQSSSRGAFARLLALVRFLRSAKSSEAVRLRRLLFLGATSVTGFSALLVYYLARGFCQTPLEVAHLMVHVGVTVAKTVAQYIARGFRPLYPKWTFSFEVLRAVMRCATELYGHRISEELHAKHIRRASEVYGTSLGWLYAKIHKTRVEPVIINDLEHVWIKSAGSHHAPISSENRFVVIYYHGGGYAVLSPRMYIGFCNTLRSAIHDELKKHTASGQPVPQVDFFLANYRKIPEHPFPVPAQDAVAIYEHVVEHYKILPQRIIIAGDSAGGGLTLSTLLRLRDNKPHLLPLGAMLCCPVADLSEKENFVVPPHCVLSMSMVDACRFTYHTTTADKSTWLDASPAHCDLRGLPPVFLQTATLDFLFHHSQRLMDKAAQDGVLHNWETDVQDDVPHVFTVFPTTVLPHAMVGIQNMARFAAKHFHKVAATCDDETRSGPLGA